MAYDTFTSEINDKNIKALRVSTFTTCAMRLNFNLLIHRLKQSITKAGEYILEYFKENLKFLL